MHEISIAGAIIDSVLEEAGKNNATKVNQIYLEIGELTALNPDQLKFVFETISNGTLAEGAIYDIRIIKTSIICKKCLYDGPIELPEKMHFFMPVLKCPQCDASEVEIRAGRECCVTKINIS